MNKEKNYYNSILLNIGITLLICTSLFYLINIYSTLSDLGKVVSLIVQMILFLFISFVFKKINNKYGYNISYFIFTLFIPIIMYLINYYNFLPVYFKSEAGLFIYLSIISFVLSILYLVTYFINKNKFYLFLSVLLDFIFFILLFKGFSLTFMTIILILLSITLITNIIINIVKKDIKIRNIYNISLSIILLFISIYEISFVLLNNTFINELAILILIFINLFIMSKNSFIAYINPWIYSILLLVFTINNFSIEISISSLSIFLILLYIKSNIEKISFYSYIFCFIFFYIVLNIISFNNYNLSVIINIVFIIFSLYINKSDNKIEIKKLFESIISISTIIVSYNILKKININSNIYLIISCLLNYVYYLIFSRFKKENVFNIFYLLLLIISLVFSVFIKDTLFIVFNLLLWTLIYFINKLKKEKEFNTFYIIGMIISTLSVFSNVNISFSNICLFISFILFLLYEFKTIKKEIYLIIGFIILVLNILYSLPFSNSYFILFVSILYSYSYLKIAKLEKKYDIFKIISTFLGFLLIYNILLYIIKPVEIVDIINFILCWFILIVMYLTERETNKRLLLYSISVLLPYYSFINSLNIPSLYVLPFIIYLLVISKVFDIKNKNIILIAIIFLSILTINSSIYNIIVDFIIFLVYIFYGTKNDEKKYVYFSIVYLFIVLMLSLNNIFGSITLIISLLLLSVILIIYSLKKR